MKYLVALAAVSGLSFPSLGDEDYKKAWSIQLENDVFSQFLGLRDNDSEAPGFDGDKDYTQGFRLGYTVRDKEKLPFYRLMKSFPLLGGVKGDDVKLSYQIFLGQNIYTPTEIGIRDVQLDDRPYAGWLYLGSNITRQTGYDLESFELDIGIMGPLSGAEQVQRGWHALIDTRKPQGWDNQLNNEPGFSLIYTRARNIPVLKAGGDGEAYLDITPHGTLALGTIYTHASVGATLRFGSGLDRELMNPNRVQPSQPGTDIFNTGGFDVYGFISGEARLVGRNAFLDGNLFTGSHSIDKNHLVGDLALGVVAFTNKWRFSYTHVFRSDEFDGQSGGHYFGSISITRIF